MKGVRTMVLVLRPWAKVVASVLAFAFAALVGVLCYSLHSHYPVPFVACVSFLMGGVTWNSFMCTPDQNGRPEAPRTEGNGCQCDLLQKINDLPPMIDSSGFEDVLNSDLRKLDKLFPMVVLSSCFQRDFRKVKRGDLVKVRRPCDRAGIVESFWCEVKSRSGDEWKVSVENDLQFCHPFTYGDTIRIHTNNIWFSHASDDVLDPGGVDRIQKKLKNAESRKMGTLNLYHITDETSAAAIQKSGTMLRGKHGAYGAGIYFAASALECERKATSQGWLITAEVDMGTALVVHDTHDYTHALLKKNGFKSVYAPKGPNGGAAEYVVYNYGQVKIKNAEPYKGSGFNAAAAKLTMDDLFGGNSDDSDGDSKSDDDESLP